MFKVYSLSNTFNHPVKSIAFLQVLHHTGQRMWQHIWQQKVQWQMY